MKKLLFMLLLMVIAQPIVADTVPYTLNCAGTYDENSGAWVHNFDLGVTFTEITQVSIQWSGTMEAAIVSVPEGSGPWDSIIFAGLTTDPDDSSTTVFASAEAGAATDPAPEPFDCESVFELNPTQNWTELLDGQGRVSIQYTEVFFLEGMGSYILHGEVCLNDATLVIEGTVVPEPISLTMLLLGAAAVLRKK